MPHLIQMLNIVIDTREQTPLHFPEHLARTEIGTLKTGDYALKGDSGFAVERKSLDDFLGTVCTQSGWDRFRREIYRAQQAGFVLPIVVEATVDSLYHRIENGKIVPPDHNHPCVSSGFAMKRIGELHQIGASVMFADCPMYATAMTYALLAARDEAVNHE